MATAPSQPPANSANAPANGTIRPSSTGPAIGASSLSKPLEIDASLNTTAIAAPSSLPNDNSLVPLNTPPLNTSPGAEMRIYPRDGRVRNPVPSKLKNVNELMKGNFGVMHMDVVSHRATEGRDAAAKRTSEGTALQAKLAQTDVYVSHQRRANYPKPPGLKQFMSPKKSDEPVVVERGPPRALTVAQTKAEQARLLTLLRTLPHHTIVDQICKGLAFFGGVPDAPPPAGGVFPESARANGSGSLFVGWIGEIFPDVSNPHPQYIEDAVTQTAGQKRPRGRPKGSKARKTRSDKGLKKGPQKGSRGADDQTQDPQDDSWVDVDESVLELNDEGDMADAMAALRDAPGTSTGLNDGGASTTTPAKGSTASFRSINDGASLTPSSSAKKRGRPKGSKNRPKDKSVLQSLIPPKITPVPVPVPMLDGQPKNKTSSAKGKQPKSRPKPTTESSNYTASANNASQHVDSNTITEHLPSAQAPASALDFTNEFTPPTANGAMTHNHESHQSGQAVAPTLPSPASQIKASTVTAKKRKRPGVNSTTQVEGVAPPGAAPSSSQNQSNTIPVTSAQLQNQATQNIHQPTPSSVAIPGTKRIRKSQDSPTITTVRRQTPNSMNQKISIPPLSTLDDHTHEPRPEDVAQSHREAEGLEAHYVSMHSNTDQMQNYNRSQHKQQPQSTGPIGSTVSPVPAAASTATGLESRLEHFTALQNLSEGSRQATTGRQKQQRSSQTASPIPTQPSNLPQMSAALLSQQQPRSSQNFYAQGQGLGSSYNAQQQPYSSTQRSQQHMSSASPSTGLVPHVTNSPQFSTQSNSPLMQTESNFRGSPSLMHSNAPFGARRPPSASPLDNSTAYRSTSATNHGVANQSPHFGTRQTSATTATHNTSHSGLSSAFPNFSDSALFDLALDSGGSHGNMGMGGNSYGLNNSAVPQQQRSSSSNAAPLYSSSGINNTYLGSTNMGRTSQQPRWPS
ncbi:hypothetical protein F4678DRAFT_328335 [Xylaria arbuscula]|nr:hypothetical protein F4678DRAFT_328335 [Xylaria arbuscula]